MGYTMLHWLGYISPWTFIKLQMKNITAEWKLKSYVSYEVYWIKSSTYLTIMKMDELREM